MRVSLEIQKVEDGYHTLFILTRVQACFKDLSKARKIHSHDPRSNSFSSNVLDLLYGKQQANGKKTARVQLLRLCRDALKCTLALRDRRATLVYR